MNTQSEKYSPDQRMTRLCGLLHQLQAVVFQLTKDPGKLRKVCHTLGTVVYLGIHW